MKCHKKKKYKNKDIARDKAIEGMQKSENPKLKLWIYKCPKCKRWHLTKMIPKKNQRYGL